MNRKSKVVFQIYIIMIIAIYSIFAVNMRNDIHTEVAIKNKIVETTPVETESIEVKDEYTPVEKIHYVKSGESFASISNDNYGDTKYCYALAEWNNNDNYIIHPNDTVKIPELEDDKFQYIYRNNTQTRLVASIKVSRGTTPTKKVEDIKIEESNPTVVRNNPDSIDTSQYQYLGSYKITGYAPTCAHCCGKTNGITASGTKATAGRTIAAKGLEFGTKVYIEGYGYYVVEDRGGFKDNVIDMAADTHEDCYKLTNNSGVNVYVVPN